MEALKAALLAKKRIVEEVKSSAGDKKYITRKELLEAEEARQRAREKETKKRNRDEEITEASKKIKESKDAESIDSSSSFSQASISSSSATAFYDPSEIKLRLRTMGYPITLFGETDTMRLDRLKTLELSLHERAVGSTGKGNSMQQILEQEVARELQQLAEAEMEAQRLDRDDLKQLQAKKEQRKASKYDTFRTRSEFTSAEDFVFYWFKHLLRMWERDLQGRPDAEKRSAQGIMASATQKQTRHNLKPLMRMLKDKSLEADLLRGLDRLWKCCERRDYKRANEEYLTLAIGNAAWPIGVTMVGIHERSGREKIFAQNIPHVLNDETQRKYIQGVKRLMTYCQTKYPAAVNNAEG